MLFTLNYRSGRPVYLQLVEQVRAASASGALRPGDPLPSIRTLAEELRVNRNTVAKAFAELEAQGIVETAHGKGCFISAAPSQLRKDARHKALADVLDEAAVQAHHLQVGRSDFLRIAAQRFDALEGRRTKAAAVAAPAGAGRSRE